MQSMILKIWELTEHPNVIFGIRGYVWGVPFLGQKTQEKFQVAHLLENAPVFGVGYKANVPDADEERNNIWNCVVEECFLRKISST